MGTRRLLRCAAGFILLTGALASPAEGLPTTHVESLGGELDAKPAAVSWALGRYDVFVTGTDGLLYHKWYDGTGWHGYESLGAPPTEFGQIFDGPAVSSWAAGRLDVFVWGDDDQLWHRFYDGGWSGWEPLGGVLNSPPSAVSWANGRIDVFVQGVDNQVWHKFYDRGWSGWEPLGGASPDFFGPAVASWGTGRLDLFVTGTDFQLWHKFYEGGWSGWEPLGGDLVDDPGAAAEIRSDARRARFIRVYGPQADGSLLDSIRCWFFDSDHGWFACPSPAGVDADTAVVPVLGPGNREDAFYRIADEAGSLGHWWLTPG